MLTREQVQVELDQIIDTHPDSTGKVWNDFDQDAACVYFLDEHDQPIGLSFTGDSGAPQLKTPVCIVGQWIESFHPELKQDNVIHDMLVRNGRISTIEPHPVLTESVVDLLSRYQNCQDDPSTNSWANIPYLLADEEYHDDRGW